MEDYSYVLIVLAIMVVLVVGCCYFYRIKLAAEKKAMEKAAAEIAAAAEKEAVAKAAAAAKAAEQAEANSRDPFYQSTQPPGNSLVAPTEDDLIRVATRSTTIEVPEGECELEASSPSLSINVRFERSDEKRGEVVVSPINPHDPKSYGKHLIGLKGVNGYRKNIEVELAPPPSLQLPWAVRALRPGDTSSLPSHIHLFDVNDKKIYGGEIGGDAENELKIPAMPDGCYLLVVTPHSLGKERCFRLVVANQIRAIASTTIALESQLPGLSTGAVAASLLNPRDAFGNILGGDYVKVGGLKGLHMLVVNLCSEVRAEQFQTDLRSTGISFEFLAFLPTPLELKSKLTNCCQFWILSGTIKTVSLEHCRVIEAFHQQGNGVYIWGDNDPWFADANALLEVLQPGVMLEGNDPGRQCLSASQDPNGMPGILASHTCFFGVDKIFEGVTVSYIKDKSPGMLAIMRDSSNHIVTSCRSKSSDRNSRMGPLLLDGGFTRLMDEFWNTTAGTSRFVVNSVAYLANFEVERPCLQVLQNHGGCKIDIPPASSE